MVSATVNSVTTTYTYRGDGLRDSRTVGMSTTTFTWDINAGLPVVLDDGNQYLCGAGLSAMKQSGTWFCYLADGLGSTMAAVDSDGGVVNGYTYDVYGTPTVTGSLANEFDFAGQQTDPTGLQYLRARYYDPETGVFLSREPLALRPGWMRSPFGYAGANPARFLDPTGLVPVDGDRPVADCQVGYCTSYGQLYDYGYPDAFPEWGSGTAIHWTLIGEYVGGKIVGFARLYGFYALSENPDWVDVFEQLGPKIRDCAADVVCANIVSAILGVAAALSFAFMQPEIWGPLGAASAAWTGYSLAAHQAVKAQQDARGVREADGVCRRETAPC